VQRCKALANQTTGADELQQAADISAKKDQTDANPEQSVSAIQQDVQHHFQFMWCFLGSQRRKTTHTPRQKQQSKGLKEHNNKMI
jgi:hypothetical protein